MNRIKSLVPLHLNNLLNLILLNKAKSNKKQRVSFLIYQLMPKEYSLNNKILMLKTNKQNPLKIHINKIKILHKVNLMCNNNPLDNKTLMISH